VSALDCACVRAAGLWRAVGQTFSVSVNRSTWSAVEPTFGWAHGPVGTGVVACGYNVLEKVASGSSNKRGFIGVRSSQPRFASLRALYIVAASLIGCVPPGF